MDYWMTFHMKWKIQLHQTFTNHLYNIERIKSICSMFTCLLRNRKLSLKRVWCFIVLSQQSIKVSYMFDNILQPVLPWKFCKNIGHCLKSCSSSPYSSSRSVTEPLYQLLGVTKFSASTHDLSQTEPMSTAQPLLRLKQTLLMVAFDPNHLNGMKGNILGSPPSCS